MEKVTTGDKILDVALSKIGEKSLFTKVSKSVKKVVNWLRPSINLNQLHFMLKSFLISYPSMFESSCRSWKTVWSPARWTWWCTRSRTCPPRCRREWSSPPSSSESPRNSFCFLSNSAVSRNFPFDVSKSYGSTFRVFPMLLSLIFKARGSPRRRADQVLAGIENHLLIRPPGRRRCRNKRSPQIRPTKGGTICFGSSVIQIFGNLDNRFRDIGNHGTCCMLSTKKIFLFQKCDFQGRGTLI